MNQKGFASFYILIGILMAAVVGGYLVNKYIGFCGSNCINESKVFPSVDELAKQTPKFTLTPKVTNTDETANWKTYTDDNLKISFQYPGEWEIKVVNKKNVMDLCDLHKIDSKLSPKEEVKFGACEGTGIAPTASVKSNEVLYMSSKKYTQRFPTITFSYYENLDNLAISEFNEKYFSRLFAGDPLVIWSPNYKEIVNQNGITAFYDDRHYCTAFCQFYVFETNNKIFMLENSAAGIENQDQLLNDDILNRVFSTFKFLDQGDKSTDKVGNSNPFEVNKLDQISNFNLPSGIEKPQLSEPLKIGDTYFVKFLKLSMNIPVDSKVERSGVLYAKGGDQNWQIFYEIKGGSKDGNNPYNFWKESNIYFTVIVDATGAGSGEGQGKLVSIDPQLKRWEIVDCFYYSPESYGEFINSLSKDRVISAAMKNYNDPLFQKYNGDYIFDTKLKKFVINGRVEENCSNVKLLL